MQPDDHDPELRAAFAELHHQQHAQAPAFEVMRERALRSAGEKPDLATPPSRQPILRWAVCAVAVGGLVAAIWQLTLSPPQERPETATSAVGLDQLIDRIEQHVEYHSAIALPDYPSDVLLQSSLNSSL